MVSELKERGSRRMVPVTVVVNFASTTNSALLLLNSAYSSLHFDPTLPQREPESKARTGRVQHASDAEGANAKRSGGSSSECAE